MVNEQISSEILVQVETFHHAELSSPDSQLFRYVINIINTGNHTVRLMICHMMITELLKGAKEISAPGVLGEMPVLQPGEKFTYRNTLRLNESIGYIRGSYTFEDLNKKDLFKVQIPTFQLIAREVYN